MSAQAAAIRALDVVVAMLVLAVTAPLGALIAVAVRLTSPGPALFRQTRVGRHGCPFVLFKFRTMRAAENGPRVTSARDARVTPLGRVLRRWKLDELPQLVNVLRGDMSLVGPRPDVPEYLAALSGIDPAYHAARPGLTDPATLAYYDEEARLAAVPDPERHYVDVILPDKIRLSAAYQRDRTLASDVAVLWRTVRRILGGRGPLAAVIAGTWLLLAARGAAGAGGVLVVAPHPDDEVLAAAGVMVAARAAGREVAIVVVTNGDYYGTDPGLVREGESVDALGVLGFAEQSAVFLGYPDAGLLSLWNDAPGTGQSYLSPRTARTTTYGARGLGGVDFHTFRTGQPGAYNQATLVDDLRAALDRFRPADVYVTGAFDAHPDHRATYYAVRSAARALAADDSTFAPTLHTTTIHDPQSYPFDDFWPTSDAHEESFGTFDDDAWPNPSLASGVPQRFDPTVPFAMPPALVRTILDWGARESLLVPPEMRVADYDTNLKAAAVRAYATQTSDHFVNVAHVKADEFFWSEPVRVGRFTADVARAARATASSAAPGQPASAAVDGVVDGAPGNPGAEWAAAGAATPATLTLEWSAPATVDRVVLFDRVGLDDHVTTARLAFDDGTTIAVGTLANDGRGDEVVLAPPHRIVRLDVLIDAAVGTPGLAEVEVFGALAGGPCTTAADCDDGNPCTTDVCRNGACAADALPDGSPCGDADACNGTEVCRAGACTREPPPDCDDGDPCTRDRCVSPGGCVHDPVCQPAPVAGRAGCSVGFVGLPRGGCEDGDPACDRDQASDGACRFDVILCANAARRGCRPLPLASVVVAGGGTTEQALGALAAALQARLPTASETCVGPVPVSLALRVSGKKLRMARRRVRVSAVTSSGRRFTARIPLACRPAPTGVVHRPPAPLVP